MDQSILTPEQRAAYERDGFVMVRGLFDPEEAILLQKAMETDPHVRGNLYNRNDAQGLATKMVLFGPESLAEPALDSAFLLQRGAQQSLHQTPSPLLHAAEKGCRTRQSRKRV